MTTPADVSRCWQVDAIHTDTSFLGLRPQLGHIDFYVNKGLEQPGDRQSHSVLFLLNILNLLSMPNVFFQPDIH